MNPDIWFFLRNGKPSAPCSWAQLVEMAHTGAILPTDLLRQEGTQRWQSAVEVEGLFLAEIPTSKRTNVAQNQNDPGLEEVFEVNLTAAGDLDPKSLRASTSPSPGSSGDQLKSAATNWYWQSSKAATMLGPFSWVQLKQMARAGQVLRTDFLCEEGTTKWIPAQLVNGLFPPVAVATAQTVSPTPISPPSSPPVAKADSSGDPSQKTTGLVNSLTSAVAKLKQIAPKAGDDESKRDLDNPGQTPEELQITFSKYISKLSELHPDETARKICETVISRLKIQARNNPELAVIVRDLQRQCAEAKAKSRKRMLFVFAGLAALLCVLGVMAFIAISHEQADSQEIKKELTKARQFWDAGNKKEAVAIYKTLIIDRQRTNWIDKSERPIVFQRAIEHEFNQGNLSSAKQLISEAKTKSIVLSFSDAKISELVAATEKHGEALPIPNALLPEKLRKDEGDGVHPITPDSGQTGSPNNKNMPALLTCEQ